MAEFHYPQIYHLFAENQRYFNQVTRALADLDYQWGCGVGAYSIDVLVYDDAQRKQLMKLYYNQPQEAFYMPYTHAEFYGVSI
jgi:hypothetical protein